MYINYLLASIPLILIVGGLIYGFTEDNYYIVLLTIGAILVFWLNENFKKLMPRKGIFMRPINDGCKCHFCPTSCPKNDEVGMPSTHAVVMAFFATMIYLRENSINLKVVGIILLALLVMGQRYYSGCHSLLQLFVGSIFGIILALFYRGALNKFKLI